MTRRSETNTFVDVTDIEDPKKAYCRICEEMSGQFNKLVPRYINNIKDDKFKVCSFCGELYPIYDVKFFTEYEPKGYISDNPFDSGSKVGIKSAKRTARRQHRNRPLVNEDVEIPKFAGRKDEFLEQKLKEGAIITSIDDSWDYESDE